MNRSWLCSLAWLVSGTFALTAQALPPAQQLVEKMALSARTLSYKGYFSYDRGQQSNSYQIVHQVEGDIERQRLVFLDGPAMEIINDGHSLKCLHSGDVDPQAHAGHPVQQLEMTPLDVSAESLQSVWQNYSASIVGNSRVANRAVTKVQLNPKDLHRYPFVFFVDDESGLMLKMLVLDAQGQLLERFHFVHVDVGEVSPQELVPQLDHYVTVDHASVGEKVDSNSDAGWHLGWVPNGFHREKASMGAQGQVANGQQVYMYSDGLSSFSVFVEPSLLPEQVDTSTQLGSTSAVSHVLKIRGAKFLVTVVGEIPIMTAKQIALSVEPAS